MSIIIEGIEMPKEGDFIVIRPDGKAYYVSANPQNAYEGEAVPVPPHGRLIDADKQDAQIEALIERHLHGYTKSAWDFVCELRDILKRNPAVIPKEPTIAEEEKNDK